MISDEHKCIFVHIPRCGGTSIECVIWPGERREDELWMGFVDEFHNKYQTGGLQHLLAKQIRRRLGERRFDEYFKFAVVRNPFDRLVSQYSYIRFRPDLRTFLGMEEDAPFASYLELIRRKHHVQWEPQVSFICDDDGSLLVDCVARFEALAEDMANVFNRLGLESLELPHQNRSIRGPYRAYYTASLRSRAEEMYGDDLSVFGYEF